LRLKFPFQYANASGIFFGVMFILARYCEFSWAKKRQYIFFLGLILTQSVGSIGVTVIAEICLSKNLKRTLMILGVLIVGAVFLKGRVYQSIGTFEFKNMQMNLSDYLVNAGEYHFMIKAKAISSDYINDSNFASVTAICKKQLNEVTDINVAKLTDENRYMLTFKEQTLAAKYFVQGKMVDAKAHEPEYLRLSQAERERMEQSHA